MVLHSFVKAVEDAKEYLCITTDEFMDFAMAWTEKEKILFMNRNSLNTFYENWKDDFARYNICANILNQHMDSVSFQLFYNYFSKYHFAKNTLIDYGCGTASLSLAFAIEKLVSTNIILLDVKNDINDFIKFRVAKHKLSDTVSLHDVLLFDEKGCCDGLYCIDVLEHLENSSEVFINRVHPMLRVGGIMYLKAPWRGQLTHIDEAADNFYLKGGRKLLGKKYDLVYRAGAMDIMGIYRKIAE